MRVADTSALYAFADEDDAHHSKALAAVEDPDPIVVPTEILVELHNLVAFRSGAGAARATLEDILSLPHVRVADRVPFDGVWALYSGPGAKLSLADAFVVQTCRSLGADPLSFDKHLLKAAR
jgi:predicted nucleic acid-binding protein